MKWLIINDFIFHSTKKSNKKNIHFSLLNSFNKNINGISELESFLEEAKDYERKKNNINENIKYLKMKS